MKLRCTFVFSHMFSSRLQWDTLPNELTKLLQRKRQDGFEIIDLTVSNPTKVGLSFPVERIRRALATPEIVRYEPLPRGMLSAREAVSRYYADSGIIIPPDHIHLTSSTSEGYSWLFKLLCDPGDRVLVPRPAYPLLEFLAAMEKVELDHYALANDRGVWRIDFESIEEQITDRTRALVLINPNNPTGSYVTREERERMAALSDRRSVPLVVDEVFFDYRFDPGFEPASALEGADEAMVFVLNGLSKSLALPQVKLGWIITRGPEPLAAEARAGLDLIADTYLSVGTPVQCALPELFGIRNRMQEQIRDRCRMNHQVVCDMLDGNASVFPVEGGWSAVVQIDEKDERFALAVLEREHVLVHPGFFYDFEEHNLFVLSLLLQPETLQEGLRRLRKLLA